MIRSRLRWWLLVPVAVVLVLLATGSRLQIFWWPNELHDETSGRQGDPVSVVDHWEDADGGDHTRRFDVTLVDVRPARFVEGFDGPEPLVPPSGVAVWQVVLEFDVDPDVPMGLCEVSVIDDRGRESAASGGSIGDTYLPRTSCEPENRKGPDYDGKTDSEVLPRLQVYRLSVYAVTADDVVPAAVRVWWEPPDYTEIEVSDG